MVLTVCSSTDCEYKNSGASVLFCTIVVQGQDFCHAYTVPSESVQEEILLQQLPPMAELKIFLFRDLVPQWDLGPLRLVCQVCD